MGNLSSFLSPHLWREDEPESFAPYKYDHRFGFEDKPRPEKVRAATEEQMNSVGLLPMYRDFCAGLRLEHIGCLAANWPMSFRCKGLNNELAHCYQEERIHDMKEFEREKRLNARERRLKEKS